MLKRAVFAVVLGASLAASAVTQARETGITGIVTKVGPNAIEVLTDSRQETSVIINTNTTYRKWLMAKPWQQDLRADSRSLRAGRRVHIDVTPGARPVARTVWIVTGRPGVD